MRGPPKAAQAEPSEQQTVCVTIHICFCGKQRACTHREPQVVYAHICTRSLHRELILIPSIITPISLTVHSPCVRRGLYSQGLNMPRGRGERNASRGGSHVHRRRQRCRHEGDCTHLDAGRCTFLHTAAEKEAAVARYFWTAAEDAAMLRSLAVADRHIRGSTRTHSTWSPRTKTRPGNRRGQGQIADL